MPSAKILRDIFIFRGTDKLIFIDIQNFFYSYRRANNFFFYFILVMQTRKVKLLVSRLLFSHHI